jgi:hypothetical protein
LIYTLLFEKRQTLIYSNLHLKLKQRIRDRLKEASEIFGVSDSSQPPKEDNDDQHSENEAEKQKPIFDCKLDPEHMEILNIITNYVDLYHSNVEVKSDVGVKFAYAIHVLNHVLK